MKNKKVAIFCILILSTSVILASCSKSTAKDDKIAHFNTVYNVKPIEVNEESFEKEREFIEKSTRKRELCIYKNFDTMEDVENEIGFKFLNSKYFSEAQGSYIIYQQTGIVSDIMIYPKKKSYIY